MALKKVTRDGGQVVCTCGYAFDVPWQAMQVTENDVGLPPCPGCRAQMTLAAPAITEEMLQERDDIVQRFVLHQNLHCRAVAGGAAVADMADAKAVRAREYDLHLEADEIVAELPPVVAQRRKQYEERQRVLGDAEAAAAAVRSEVTEAQRAQRKADRAALREQLRARMAGERAAADAAAQAAEQAAVPQRQADRQRRLAAAEEARAVWQERMARLQARHEERVRAFAAAAAQEAGEAGPVGPEAPVSASVDLAEPVELVEPTAENTFTGAPAEARSLDVGKRRGRGR